MVGPFALDYFIFVLIAALGVLQMVAAYSTLRGLLLIRVRPMAFLVGLVTTIVAFLWFFLSEPRNLPDTEGGLDGNQMAGLFALAAGSALVLTLFLSSISNRSLGRGFQQRVPGLDALRETSYLKALLGTLKTLRLRSGRGLWKRY